MPRLGAELTSKGFRHFGGRADRQRGTTAPSMWVLGVSRRSRSWKPPPRRPRRVRPDSPQADVFLSWSSAFGPVLISDSLAEVALVGCGKRAT